MEGPRACRKDELNGVLELINNCFRTSVGLKPTMGEEFPLLLGEDNLNNIRIILEDNKVVADVNFYPSEIMIEGFPIKAASIGAVCTDETARNKGYSSRILDDIEEIFKSKSIPLMLVSGTRGLYLRRGCCITGIGYKYRIEDMHTYYDDILLKIINFDNIYPMLKIYNRENTRFYRKAQEFKGLLKGATTPWGNFNYKIFLVGSECGKEAYVILRIIDDKKERYGEIVEFAGDRSLVIKACYNLIKDEKLSHIIFYSTDKDHIMDAANEFSIIKEKISLPGTIKIVDFISFMEQLKPYYSQYLDEKVLDKFVFEQHHGKYLFKYGNEVLEIDDMQTLTDIIFGSNKELNLKYDHCKCIKDILEKIFPIPFIWPDNINFQ